MDDDVSMNRADSSVLMGTSSVASSMFRNEVNLKPLLTESQIAKRQERIDNCKKRETYQRYLAAVPKVLKIFFSSKNHQCLYCLI